MWNYRTLKVTMKKGKTQEIKVLWELTYSFQIMSIHMNAEKHPSSIVSQLRLHLALEKHYHIVCLSR